MSQLLINSYRFGGAAATTPLIRDTIIGASSSEVDPHVLVFPDYEIGDVVAFFFRSQSSTTLTTPAGWTNIVGRSQSGDSEVLVREMDGTEGASVNYATSTARRASWVGYSLGRVDVPTSIGTGEHTGTIDPPSESFAWGSGQETLVIAMASARITDNTLTLPASYSDQVDSVSNAGDATTASVRVATSHRVLTATSEDPGTYSSTGTLDNPHGLTVAFPLVAA